MTCDFWSHVIGLSEKENFVFKSDKFIEIESVDHVHKTGLHEFSWIICSSVQLTVLSFFLYTICMTLEGV